VIEGRCARVAGEPLTWRIGPVYFDEWRYGAGARATVVAMAEGDSPHHPGQRCTVVRLAMLAEDGRVMSHVDTSLSRLLQRGCMTGRVLAMHTHGEQFDVEVVLSGLTPEVC
jgi:hypothetical protein